MDDFEVCIDSQQRDSASVKRIQITHPSFAGLNPCWLMESPKTIASFLPLTNAPASICDTNTLGSDIMRNVTTHPKMKYWAERFETKIWDNIRGTNHVTEVIVSMFGTTIRTSCSVSALRVDKCNFYDIVLARCARRRRQRVSFRLALTGAASQLSHFTHFLAEKNTPSENSLQLPTTCPTIPHYTLHITQELGSIQFECFILLSSTHPSYILRYTEAVCT